MRILIFAFLLFGICACQPEAPKQNSKPTVLVSIVPYAYFVKRIASDAVNVEVFVPKGADPHVYEPTPRQVETAHAAKLWLRTGEPFEDKVSKVFSKSNTPVRMLQMWEELQLLPLDEKHHAHCCEEGQDRHVWLSPKLAKIQAKRIYEALSQLFPEQRAHFKKGLTSFLADLDELDHEITVRFAQIKNAAILVSHPAFGYFCHDYHLRQLALEEEGKEALPQKIALTLKEASSAKVRCVIAQGQYGIKSAELVAKELNVPIFQCDPYALDLLENLRTLSKIIANHYQN